MGENRMITCKQVATLLTSGEVERQSAWGRWEVRFHLWMCKNCSRLAGQLEQIHQAGRKLRSTFESEQPAGDPAGMEARLLKKLRAPPPAGRNEG